MDIYIFESFSYPINDSLEIGLVFYLLHFKCD